MSAPMPALLSVPIVRSRADLRAIVAGWKAAGETVGVVPTMGALHAGHLSLVRAAKAASDRVVVTLFVNPRQFNNAADLAAYPRTEEADARQLAPLMVDLLYVPDGAEMYPEGFATTISVAGVSEGLCGAHRPGHFDGVATVVTKLLLQTGADRAYFGEKDWQQLQLVQGMVKALFVPVQIIACPTVRDDDGLALSSRNRRLSQLGRAHAMDFPRALRTARDAASAAANLKMRGFEVDYVEDFEGVRVGAVRVDGVRLIDSVRL